MTQRSPSLGIDLFDVTISYRRIPAVHHLSGTFEPGSLTAIVGPNGAGKSTLLKGIAGLLPVDEGSIGFDDISQESLAYLPQRSDIDLGFPITVEDLVSLGAWRATGGFRALDHDDMAMLREALASVGLSGMERRIVSTLSGGQMQRALFARLMMQDASLLLLDEPFVAIDTTTTSDLVGLIERWHGEGRTIVAVLHDIDFVREHFPMA